VASICSIECSWLLRHLRTCFQSKIPFLIRKCAHSVVSAHISLQVKHLTHFCQGEKQSQLLSTTSPLWVWRRLRLVVHFRDKFLSFLCCGTSCWKTTFHHNVNKNLFHISTNIHAFFRYISWPEGPETDIVATSDSVSRQPPDLSCFSILHRKVLLLLHCWLN